MRTPLQTLLLGAYGLVRRTGVLATPLGRQALDVAYRLYKRHEAGAVDHLRQWVVPGSWVIDVGANIGYFAERFAQWVGEGGGVLCYEPEPQNHDRLVRRLASLPAGRRAITIQAAVADVETTLRLALNPDNFADHRLAEEGTVPVRAVRLDDEMERRGWPRVSFIKIDVQGAECRVLDGAATLLTRFRPALFVEVDASDPLHADALLARLDGLGYVPHRLLENGGLTGLTRDEARRAAEDAGYIDLVFLCSSAKGAAAP
jgi:FkbM family methyltransferase